MKKILHKILHNTTKWFRFKDLFNKFNDSIRVKIIVITSVLILSIMLIADGIVYYVTYSNVYRLNNDNMKIISEEITNNFESLIQVQQNDLQKMSKDSDLINFCLVRGQYDNNSDYISSNKAQASLIDNKLKSYDAGKSYIESVFVTDKNGIITDSSNDDYKGMDLGHSSYININNALSGKDYISDVYTSVVSSKPIITFLEPIKDNSGNLIGMVGKCVTIDYFSARFDNFHFMNTGYIFIVNKNENIIYNPQKYYINKKLDISDLNYIFTNKDTNSNVTGSTTYMDNNTKYYCMYSYVPDLNSYMFLTVSENQIKSTANTIGYTIVGITLILIIIVTFLLNMIIKKIFNQLDLLIKNTDEISKGNLVVVSKAKNNDEIGKLSSSFNNMSHSLKKLIGKINLAIDDMLSINNIINSSHNRTIESMDVISSNTKNFIKETDDITNAVEWSFKSFGTIKDKLFIIKEESAEALNETNKIKNVNSEGVIIVNKLKTTNIDAQEKMEAAKESFSTLSKNLNNISEIIKVVNKISEQTHILALNASIEGARYGEMGKGFSVVADEIKKLSFVISDKMNSIEDIIKHLNVNLSNVEDRIEKVKDVSVFQYGLVNDTIEKYNYMMSSTEEIINFIDRVDNSIENLENENTTLYDKLNEVKEACKYFNEAIITINEVVSDQYNETKDMEQLIVKMHDTTDLLGKSVKKFNI